MAADNKPYVYLSDWLKDKTNELESILALPGTLFKQLYYID